MTNAEPGEISLESLVAVTDGQLTSQLGDESVILSLNDGMYYGLDAIGTRIWGKLATPRKLGDICKEIERDYDVGVEECHEAVLALVRELAARDLVEVR